MAIDRIYYCEAEDCEAHCRTATPPPYLPLGFIEARVGEATEDVRHHFCSWDCLMKFAAQQPVSERIDLDDQGVG